MLEPAKKYTADDYVLYKQSNALVDRGSPEAEAMKWRTVSWLWKTQRPKDSYWYTVKYHDYPEGEDLAGKLIAVNRLVYPYCLVSGLMMGLMEQRTTGLGMAFVRGYNYFWPGLAAASMFTSVAYFGAHFRGKDDVFNYWAGAIGAGYVFGKWRHSHVIGWGASVFFLFLAGIEHKHMKLGMKWWNFEENLMGGHNWHKFGWDLFEDVPEKGYTTSYD